MAEESNVPALALLRKSPARILFFAGAREPKLPLRKSRGRANDKVRTLVSAKRTREKHSAVRLVSTQSRICVVVAPVDAVINRLHVRAAELLGHGSHVPAVANSDIALPNRSKKKRTVILFESSRYHVGHERRLE